MEAKFIVKKQDFQKDVVRAVKLLAHPVKATLGPDGLPILLDRMGMPPLVTKDGVTVANTIFVDDPQLNTIIQSIKEASMKTNTIAGDGTTTAILLTEALIEFSQSYLRTNAITPQTLGDELQHGANLISNELLKMAIKINDDIEKIKNVATISANGDEEISNAVVSAIDAVGEDGVVTLEDGGAESTTLRIEEGFSINRGYGHIAPVAGLCLVNSLKTQEVIYQNPAIILFNSIVDNVQDLQTCLVNLTNNGTKPIPTVLMAHDFAPPVIQMIMINAKAGRLQCLPVKIPKLGAKFSQSDVLHDIAILTGGKVINPGENSLSSISDPSSGFLGSCEKVVGSRRTTVLFNGKGLESEIKDRADALRLQMKELASQWERDIVKERLGRLIGSIAVIGVGGVTDLEQKEKKDRIEDALNATRAALEEGVLPGGGTALLKINTMDLPFKSNISKEIFKKVCEAPIRQIVSNTGRASEDIITHYVFTCLSLDDPLPYFGWNARTKQYTQDMITEGVIDPVKVVRTALLNAVSIASTLLRSGGSVIIKPNKKSEDDWMANSGMLNETIPDDEDLMS